MSNERDCASGNHVIGMNMGGQGECGELVLTKAHVENPPYLRMRPLEQAVFDSIDHPFRYCPDCGLPNAVFTGLFEK